MSIENPVDKYEKQKKNIETLKSKFVTLFPGGDLLHALKVERSRRIANPCGLQRVNVSAKESQNQGDPEHGYKINTNHDEFSAHGQAWIVWRRELTEEDMDVMIKDFDELKKSGYTPMTLERMASQANKNKGEVLGASKPEDLKKKTE